MEDTIKSPFDKQPAEGSRETIDRQLAQQEQREQQNGEALFRDQLGGAVLEVWGDLPRDLQEAIFEIAMRNAPEQRMSSPSCCTTAIRVPSNRRSRRIQQKGRTLA